MAKEKSVNPAQAAHKAEKAKALKKGKAAVQAQRQERLAKRNPERLQRDIDDLKARAEAGDLRPHDRQRLSALEKEVGSVRKAREALGDKAPRFRDEQGGRKDGGERRGGRGGARGGGVLGKRRRDGQDARSGGESSDTDEDTRHIPMPRDTPPPLPRKHSSRPNRGNANETPLGEPRVPHALPPKLVAKTVYESAPQIRDLRKEATSKFVPAAVQSKLKLARGGVQGRLLEPEELEKLEREGYKDAEKAAEEGVKEAEYKMMNREVEGPDGELDDMEAAFERELREVEMEDGKELDPDVEGAVEAAVQEAEFRMMAVEAEGQIKDSKGESNTAERELRHVEMEEVEDEDL